MTTDARRSFAPRVAAALLPLALAVACSETTPAVDPFADLRAEAAAPRGPLAPRSTAAAAEGGPIGAGAARPPVRGFVRRGRDGALGAPGGGSDLAAGGGGEFTVNFENAPMADVVRAMLEDGLGASYVLDPAVSGMVTIRTNAPLSRAQILPTLEEILRLNDAALVESAGVLRVIPREAVGLTAPLMTADSIAQRGLTTRVTPLRHVSVEDVRGVLEQFAPVAGALSYDANRNLVFSIGSSAEQRTIADLIALLDVNALAGRSVALVPLRSGDPEGVTGELDAIFAERGGRTPRLRFVPVERMSAVLVIAENPRLLDEALPVLQGLDQGADTLMQIHVMPVENREAAEMAQVLGAAFGVRATVTRAARAGGLAPGLTPSAAGAAPDAAAFAAEAEGGAAAAADIGGGGIGGGIDIGGATPTRGVARLSADEGSNAIIALADADGARRLRAAMRRLDHQPLQVMIQATLAEVTLNDRLEYGVRWFFERGNFAGSFSDVASGAVGAVFPGFSAVFDSGDVRAALSALDEITDVRFLSTPTLMVMDNQTARLQVGDQVPVTTRSSTSVSDPDAPIVTETEFRDTGIILTIRPRVNGNGLVQLDVRQEVSDVLPGPGGVNPTFSQRVVESTVAVDSGDTVAIGGLISEQGNRSRSGLPVLSNIPVVGALFGVTTTSAERTELIVLLTPVVVRDQQGARAATDELRDRLEGIFGPPPPSDPLTGPRRGALWSTGPGP
ncbi:type II secretion system secretin GspD [Rubrimonas cliftonensis]|uniref:Type II secretion system protein D (GspD) n=1 Tax=Rubrimonas cliftonensis TaxID=89524 RepID=A0A1H3WQA5_9RHOB|nr:type II secretion system secretin GspD [Rubrimonas cliftonensis]SDZ89326.1 type II secretion system protein D (GspD) [Rubrimonas cliftonensis]